MGQYDETELSNPIDQGGLENAGASAALMEKPGAGRRMQQLHLQEGPS